MFLKDAIKQGYKYSLIKFEYHVQHISGKQWKQEIFVNGKQELEKLLVEWNRQKIISILKYKLKIRKYIT